jgi:hypothetical protein
MKVVIRAVCCRWSLVAVVAWMFVVTPAAGAHHIPGATYRASLPNNGSLEFDVSADGTRITRIKVTGKGDKCEGTLEGTNLNIPINNHAFDHPNADPVAFSGSFPSKQTAQGTVTIDVDLGPPVGHCHAGPTTWTAMTGASPAGSQECRDAVGAVSAAQVQVDSAQTAATSAQSAVDRANATIAATRRKIKNGHKRLRKATTSKSKKKIQQQLKLANKTLAKARTALTNASSQLQAALAQQQDAATAQQTAAGQQQAEC